MCVRALVDPTEIYTGGFTTNSNTSDVALRIATGGAGQSGLVKGIYSHPFSSFQPSTDLTPTPSPGRRLHPRLRRQRLRPLHHRLGPQRHDLHHQKPRNRRCRPRHLVSPLRRENRRHTRYHRLSKWQILPLPRPLHHRRPARESRRRQLLHGRIHDFRKDIPSRRIKHCENGNPNEVSD
jgi:hypothetical protein